jgi:hypothetical protein
MNNTLIEQLKNERDNWEETAAQAYRNADYYRNLLVQCGQAIGKEAYTRDDGTPQADVLVAKVPGLVKKLAEEREDTADLIYNIMRDEVNAQDECEKWLRAYAPGKLNEAYAPAGKQLEREMLLESVRFGEAQPDPDHTEGGKYRMLKDGEMLQPGDEFLFCNGEPWFPVVALHPALSGQLYRRPVKPEDIDPPDYAKEARDLLHIIHGFPKHMAVKAIDNFVDLIIKAAKQ